MSTVEIFDRYYNDYDRWYEENPIIAINELRTITATFGYKPVKCAEIGVGTGWFASRVGCQYGVDPSINMLRKAVDRGIQSVAGVGESLPFRSRAFREILIVVTICFADNPPVILEESYRVMEKDGVLVVCIVPKSSPWGAYYIELGRKGHKFYSHAKFYDIDEVVSMAVKAGFEYNYSYGVLRFGPWDPPKPENPTPFTGRDGFVCMRFKKIE